MTEEERLEDEALKKCIQEAYGCSDEQLLAELDELEATISDSDFPGAEERICQKLLARAAEEESAKQEESRPSDIIEPVSAGMPPAASVRLPDGAGEKRSRFGKKKVFLVAVLAAAFVAMLGVTAIGGKSYFFRLKETDHGIVLNNSNNLVITDKLAEAYKTAAEYLDMPIMKLGYFPSYFKFLKIKYEENRVTFFFEYNDQIVHFTQEKGDNDTSFAINSDRKFSESGIKNEWLQQEIYIDQEILDNGETAYSATICIENRIYRIIGQIEKEEMEKIVKKLNFF